jgi:hypothetical protein
MIKQLIVLSLLILLQGCGGGNELKDQVDINKQKETVKETSIDETKNVVSIDKQSEVIVKAEVMHDQTEKEIDIKHNIQTTIFETSFEDNSLYYNLDFNASYDTDIKRSGERSIRLSEKEDIVNIHSIPVEEGNWYVVSGYMYIQSLPSDVIRFYIGYDREDGTHIRSVMHTLLSNASENSWEEFIVPVYIQKGKDIKNIKLFVKNTGSPDVNVPTISDVWIDDISVYKVDDSSQLFGKEKPFVKQAFDGTKVKVDSLGNFSIKENGEFEPFFPMIIYPNNDKSKWASYASAGFNTVLCNSPADAQTAVDNGMYWIWDLYSYGVSDMSASGYDRFVREYESLKPELLDKLLYFYWDNEQFYVFDSLKMFSDKIKIMDVDEDGKRMRPISMNLGLTTGSKNYYNDKYKLIDLQSVYINPLLYKKNDPLWYDYELEGFYASEFGLFSAFENIENTKLPKSVFVIDSPQDVYLENMIYSALARGGKGFAFWRDGDTQPAIETKTWWNDLPDITARLNQLLPLVRTPHWTDWELLSSLKDDEDGIVVGTRDYDSKRCMIFASRSDNNELITFTTPDRNMTDMYDFFDNTLVAKAEGKSTTISLSPHQSGVYCWE